MSVMIFALADPRDGIVRYIGKGGNRVEQLTNQDVVKHSSPWLRKLITEGIEPQVTILQTVSNCDADAALMRWAERIKDSDGRLESFTRRTWSEETREKFNASRAGVSIKQHDPEGKRAAALKAAWAKRKADGTTSWGKHTSETKKKIAEGKLRSRRGK